MPDMREEFEKEYCWPSLDERQRLIVGGSCWSVWQKAWQASRAALRVELPEPYAFHQEVQTVFRDRVKEALQQAGIEVKP
ncbi:hypothetical protein DB392_07100 [Pseudomonas aeruginosa]|nr:hypothetical protein DB392_07100 [Pseudomonas aeruginosa]